MSTPGRPAPPPPPTKRGKKNSPHIIINILMMMVVVVVGDFVGGVDGCYQRFKPPKLTKGLNP